MNLYNAPFSIKISSFQDINIPKNRVQHPSSQRNLSKSKAEMSVRNWLEQLWFLAYSAENACRATTTQS